MNVRLSKSVQEIVIDNDAIVYKFTLAFCEKLLISLASISDTGSRSFSEYISYHYKKIILENNH